MPDVILPPLPPLPPPVGSAVRPSLSAGSPPPPTAQSVSAVAPAPVEAAEDRYAPPAWLDKQRGNNRTSAVNPKVVILSVVGIFAAFVASAVILIVLAGTTQERFVEIPVDDFDRPTFPDDDVFVDSMGDPATPVFVVPAPA